MFEPLCKNANIIKSSNRLNYLALRILYLIVKRKNILGCQYCYFIDRPYNRVSDLNLFSNNLTNEKNSALSVEISCHKNSDIWHFNDEEIYKLCLDSLEKDNLISKNDIVEWKVLKIPDVYPIYKINYETDLEIIQNEFKKIKNFYSIGRLGKFYYGDIDQMIRFGFDLSKKIK